MIENFNSYQGTIEALVEDGHTILQVINKDNSSLFFCVTEFQEAFTSPTNSVEFNAVRGINVTNFFKTQESNPDIISVKHKFLDFINNSNKIRCEFSKDLSWIKWGSL